MNTEMMLIAGIIIGSVMLVVGFTWFAWSYLCCTIEIDTDI